jgi:glutathione S-transferase
MTTTQGGRVLYQFAFSHYNEKVRWALDYKGLPSRRRSLLPGLHERTVRRRSGGPTSTPLLEEADRALSGSAAILVHLEASHPAPPLFPPDAAARREVEGWIEWLDEEVGPAVRRALFHELLQEPGYAGRMFTTGQPVWKGAPYRWIFPRMVPMLRERMDIREETARAARETVGSALERIAGAARSTGHLVGDRFTAADLTAAALLFPLVFPAQLGFELPRPTPPRLEAWIAHWRGDAAVGWVETIWSKHR